MLSPVNCLAMICCLAAIGPQVLADGPPLPEGIAVIRDLRYREGPSNQWRLDLAMLPGTLGKATGLEGDGPHQGESSLVQAVVSDSGPIDLLYQYQHDQLRQVVGQFLGGPPDEKRGASYRRASPIDHISKDTPP